MATPQMISIWLTCIDWDFEQVTSPFILDFPTDNVVGQILMRVKDTYYTILREADLDQLAVWKINSPVRHPPKRYNTRSSSSLAHHSCPRMGSDETLLTLLDDIRRSSDLSPYAEPVHVTEKITDFFKKDPEQRIQAFVLCPRVSCPAALLGCTLIMHPPSSEAQA